MDFVERYITEYDEEWHDIKSESPSRTTEVQFLDHSGRIVDGEIFVDMSGHYAALPLPCGIGFTWGSLDDYKSWRFKHKEI